MRSVHVEILTYHESFVKKSFLPTTFVNEVFEIVFLRLFSLLVRMCDNRFCVYSVVRSAFLFGICVFVIAVSKFEMLGSVLCSARLSVRCSSVMRRRW